MNAVPGRRCPGFRDVGSCGRGGRVFVCALLSALVLTACGGGDETSAPGATASAVPAAAGLPRALSRSAADAAPQCAADNPLAPVASRTGTLSDEKRWLREHMDQVYLWRQEMPQVDPGAPEFAGPDVPEALAAYFQALLTPGVTPRGLPKDRFSAMLPTQEWEQQSLTLDAIGLGMEWVDMGGGAWPPDLRVARVHPASPAARAGVQRGDRLLTVDFRPVGSTADVAQQALYELLSAPPQGRVYQLGLRGPASTDRERVVTLEAQVFRRQVVQPAVVLNTPAGRVGYLAFHEHVGAAERPLVAAFRALQRARVNDLVLDLRYNGGGLAYMAAQVATMIAGLERTEGRVFQRLIFNDRRQDLTDSPDARLPFPDITLGYPGSTLPPWQTLPQLGLRRVYVLAGPGTCSASEAIVGGLRGIGLQVVVVGGTTCGKPYAMFPTDACGLTYLPIEARLVNHRGRSIGDGIVPDCAAADDLSRPLGDAHEGLLAAALALRAGRACPVRQGAGPSGVQPEAAASAPAPGMARPVRPAWRELGYF